MNELDRAANLAHSRLPAYQRRMAEAREIVREGLAICRYPYVGFSGGKDSAVMLALVAEQCPDVCAQILTGGESRLLHRDLQAILDWWRANTRVNMVEVLVDTVFGPGWESATFEEGYAQFYDGWNRYLNGRGHDGIFIGLRREESNLRNMVFKRQGAVYRYAETRRDVCAGKVRICPIFHLKEADVWAYLTVNGIPTFRAYDEGSDRTKTRLGWRAMNEFGQLAELRRYDPVGFNAIVARFPELRRLGE